MLPNSKIMKRPFKSTNRYNLHSHATPTLIGTSSRISIDFPSSLQVASSCLGSSLLKYSAKEYFFRASLCHLSVDLLNAQHALGKYAEQYPAFQDSREYKLVKVRIICQTQC